MVTAVGEEALVADRAQAGVVHLDALGLELRAGHDGEVEVAPSPRVVPGEAGVDLLAHLVAAAARAGADGGLERAVLAELAQRLDALGEDAAGQRAPAAVQGGHGVVAGHDHREAVGGEHDCRGVFERRGLAVLLRVRARVRRRLGGPADRRPVHLAPVAEALPGDADLSPQPDAVLAYVLRRVVGEQPEVQRRERAAGDPSVAAREDDLGAGQIPGDMVVLPAEGLRQRHPPEASGPATRDSSWTR